MKFFKLDKFGAMDPDECFLDNPPEGTDALTFRMAEGDRMGNDYPSDARIYMDNEHMGIRLTSIIGNTNSFLIVSREVKLAIEGSRVGKIEYLPISIYNHRRRKATDDYFIINPIGSYDCLDLKASKIKYLKDKIVAVKEFVLDAKRLKDAPDLFRLKEDPRQYIISGRLVDDLRALRATNLVVEELGISGGKRPDG